MAITDDTNFLSKLGCFHICSPTRYYTCFPLYKGFYILLVSNVSLWLFNVFSWPLFLSSFTRCMINEGDIDFSSSLGSSLSWHSPMGRILNEFLNGILESYWWFSLIFLFLPVPLTVMKFSVLSLASWVFICWTDNNSVPLSKASDSILSLLFSFCNNSTCCLIYSVCTVSCSVTFSHNRRSILSTFSAVLALSS